MPDAPDPIVTVRLERSGRTTENVISYTLDSGYTVPTDGFELKIRESDPELLRGLAMEPVEISINGNSQCIGRIERVSRQVANVATCSGRDYIADLVTNRVDPAFTVAKDSTLFRMLADVLAPNGIKEIYDANEIAMRDVRTGKGAGAAAIPGFRALKQQDGKPADGEGAYQFCARQLKRFGATLQPGISRDSVWVTAPNYQQAPLYSIRVSADPKESGKNKPIDATSTEDFADFPTYVLGLGKAGKAGKQKSDISQRLEIQDFAEALNNPKLTDTLRGVTYRGHRKPKDGPDGLERGEVYRLLSITDKTLNSQSELERRSVREFSELFKKTQVYECTLPGFTDEESGAMWAVDTLVRIDDEVRDVHEVMWIANRTFTFNARATTRLVCWRLGAYQL